MSRHDVKDVLCFQHCDRYTNILCFSVPATCPLCHKDTSRTPSRIPPYIVPSPFTNAGKYSMSLVVKPTVGSFLRDYDNYSNLHIGVTDTQGVVFDYDEDGVHIGTDGWEKCLVIPLHGITPEIHQQWDHLLQRYAHSSMWTKSRYIEESHNCFDFVINFLHHVGFSQENLSVLSRSSLTQDLILPHTTKAGHYITLYRNIVRNNCVCQSV